MASLRTWFRATQPHSFVASLVGVALGTAVAWNSTRMFDLVAFLLAAIGVVCLHAATNMSNDSIDFKRGVDDLPAHLVSPFTGGARVLPDAAVSFEAHRRVWIGFFAAAALIGIVLALLRPNGWILLVLGGIGGAIGVFYTLPPFALQYHGVGEIAVAIIFGPLVVLGSYAVQTGAVGWEPLLASIPLGLLVAAFLLVNEMPEHETDPRGGKRTIPARIGLEKSVTLYEVLVATALIFLVATSLLRLVPWVAVIGLVAVLPLARARAVLRTYYREYPAHIAANAGTIQAVLLLGAGMTAAYVIAGTTAL
ncbi:MAG: prenyltransferase [Methanobacteriota archaeon]|nr:MAG: prenyltransferase [Euryarchaeota archaeon]